MDSITEESLPQYEMCYIDHPALSALLNSKKIAPEKQGIDVAIAVKCELSDLDIPPGDICSIVGNLLENALEAAAEDNNPRVGIEFMQDHESFIIYISNNGATIPQGVDIFKVGFSTKTPETSGYGLYVVQRLLNKYHGQIDISSNKGPPNKMLLDICLVVL
ncbi:MAG: GHKL domain-containing protein [Syntrophomonadaceae bacterium]|nr:GHKL domain-containing protein [Syntrophomonadaceae bacterium]MDD4550197.1 GHKL domain-containing protein [Syntrophomonadaceae bacterium]